VGKQKCFTVDEKGIGHFYGHAAIGGEMADAILRRLKAPTALREQVVILVEHHMTILEPRRKILRRWLSRLGWDTVTDLLKLQTADMGGKGSHDEQDQFLRTRLLLEELRLENACMALKDLALNGYDMLALGYSGKEIGFRLNRLLEMVMEETVENNRDALMEANSHIVYTGENE